MAATINTGTIIDRVAEDLGEDLYARPSPQLPGILYAVAGTTVAAGVMLVSFPTDATSDSRTGPLIAALLLVAAAYGLLVGVDAARASLRPGVIAMLSIGLAGTALLIPPLDGGSAAIRGLLMALAFGVAWFAPHSRGRPWLLGWAIVGLWVALIDAVENEPLTSGGFDTPAAASNGIGAASLIFGLMCLAVMYALDRRGMRGSLATPFAAVGTAAFVVGVSAVVGDITSAAGIGTLVLLGGVFLVWLGARGRDRRLTAWLGGGGVFIGLASYAGEIYDGDNPRVGGVVLAVLGLALAVGAHVVSDRFAADEEAAAAPVGLAPGTGTESVAAGPLTPTDTGVVETPASPLPAPGWYPDPTGAHAQRYWDGGGWTEHVADA